MNNKAKPATTGTKYITIAFVQRVGTLNPEWNHTLWSRELTRLFASATVLCYGYNFNGETGVHVVRMFIRDEPDKTFTIYSEYAAALLDGSIDLPANAPADIDLERSAKHGFIDGIFDKYRKPNFDIDIQVVYGAQTDLNNYLLKCTSQKHIDIQFNHPADKIVQLLFQYKGEQKSDFEGNTYKFIGSFKKLGLISVTQCEAYRYVGRVLQKAKEIAQEKPQSFELLYIAQDLQWLEQDIWKDSSTSVQCVVGAGKFYSDCTNTI